MDKNRPRALWRAAASFILTLLLAGFLDLPAVKSAKAATQSQAEPVMRLADLEEMALQGNPTLAQAEAAVRAAEGRRVQAGLLPNPILGYAGEELAVRAIGDKSEHLFFFEQSIPLGGKLKKSRHIFAQEKVQAAA
jgi:outer membrane protein TolC